MSEYVNNKHYLSNLTMIYVNIKPLEQKQLYLVENFTGYWLQCMKFCII